MKKAWINYILMASLLLAGFSVQAAENSIVRVGLFYGSSSKQAVSVGADSPITIRFGADVMVSELAISVNYAPASDSLTFYYGEMNIDAKKELTVSSQSGIISIEGKKYRGEAVLQANGGGITVINALTMDQYLYGVLPSEVPASWNSQALNAQAVCSRSYATARLGGRHAADGFDLCASTHCQVYSGIEKEHPATNAAVDATSGQVLTYQSQVVEAIFGSSNGGYIEDPANVWGSSVPYLVSKKDEYEKTEEISSAVWQVNMTLPELTSMVKNKGVDVGDVTRLRILETAPSGRVTKLEITGTLGTYVAQLEETRTILGLKSQLYTISGGGSGSISVIGQDGIAQASPLTIMGEGEAVTQDGAVKVIFSEGITTLEQASADGTITITGRGYGHGVGLSQYGAKYMAEAGFGYQEILQYYFPGTQIG